MAEKKYFKYKFSLVSLEYFGETKQQQFWKFLSKFEKQVILLFIVIGRCGNDMSEKEKL